MTDSASPRPAPIPAPDRHQIERLNILYDLSAPGISNGWCGRLADRLRPFLARILFRQQEFNAAVVDHMNRNALVGIEAHHASAQTIEWVIQTFSRVDQTFSRVDDTLQATLDRLDAAVDELRRYEQALIARERRSEATVASLVASHDELRTSIGVLQQATQSLKREVARGRYRAGYARPGGANWARRSDRHAPDVTASHPRTDEVGDRLSVLTIRSTLSSAEEAGSVRRDDGTAAGIPRSSRRNQRRNKCAAWIPFRALRVSTTRGYWRTMAT